MVKGKGLLAKKKQNNSRISLALQYKRKHFDSAYDDSNYYGLRDLEYTFDDLDFCYKSILAKENFNGNYQVYTCRSDKDRDMPIYIYLEKVTPFLRILIDEKKTSDQKIQIDIRINLRQTTEDKRITFYVKTATIRCLPSDNTDDILEQLIASFYKFYNEKLLICRTDSSFAYESVEGLGINFHNIDLNMCGSYITSPDWLKNKGATINPQNARDNYCYMYAITIALNHKEIGRDLEHISA